MSVAANLADHIAEKDLACETLKRVVCANYLKGTQRK